MCCLKSCSTCTKVVEPSARGYSTSKVRVGTTNKFLKAKSFWQVKLDVNSFLSGLHAGVHTILALKELIKDIGTPFPENTCNFS